MLIGNIGSEIFCLLRGNSFLWKRKIKGCDFAQRDSYKTISRNLKWNFTFPLGNILILQEYRDLYGMSDIKIQEARKCIMVMN